MEKIIEPGIAWSDALEQGFSAFGFRASTRYNYSA